MGRGPDGDLESFEVLSTGGAPRDAIDVTPSPRHPEDKALVMAVLAGLPEARATFVERMRAVARMLASQNRRLSRPLQDAELADVVQETLLQVWRKLPTYRGDASLETWAWRFSSLELASARRKRARGAERQAGEVTDEVAGAAEEPPPLDDELAGLLRHLSPREADVVRLVHVHELGLRDVAERLGISVSSVKTHYYRGLDKLRAVIESRRAAELDAREGRGDLWRSAR